jgi:hypothetical protein
VDERLFWIAGGVVQDRLGDVAYNRLGGQVWRSD